MHCARKLLSTCSSTHFPALPATAGFDLARAKYCPTYLWIAAATLFLHAEKCLPSSSRFALSVSTVRRDANAAALASAFAFHSSAPKSLFRRLSASKWSASSGVGESSILLCRSSTDHLFFFAALAFPEALPAFRAISERSSAVIVLSLALPPRLPAKAMYLDSSSFFAIPEHYHN